MKSMSPHKSNTFNTRDERSDTTTEAATVEITDTDTNLDTVAGELAEAWFRRQSRNRYTNLYLYHRPSLVTGSGAVAISEDPPGPEWERSAASRISPALTQDQARAQIRAAMRSDPILPVADTCQGCGDFPVRLSMVEADWAPEGRALVCDICRDH